MKDDWKLKWARNESNKKSNAKMIHIFQIYKTSLQLSPLDKQLVLKVLATKRDSDLVNVMENGTRLLS